MMSTGSIVVLILFFVLVIGIYKSEDLFNTSTAEQVTAWLFFNVIFALLPLIFNAGVFLLRGLSIDFSQLLIHGELFIVSAGIAADATGKVLTSKIDRRLSRILATAGCITLLALSSLIFAYIASQSAVLNPARVRELSFMIFGLTMLSSTPCILMTAKTGGGDHGV